MKAPRIPLFVFPAALLMASVQSVIQDSSSVTSPVDARLADAGGCDPAGCGAGINRVSLAPLWLLPLHSSRGVCGGRERQRMVDGTLLGRSSKATRNPLFSRLL